VTVSADRNSSDVQDLQSLALHTAAVRLIKQDERLRTRAKVTLHNWLAKDPGSRSTPLWQEWERILSKGSYRLILGRSARAQQLRQASPLPTVLTTEQRQALLEEVRQLKNGMLFDNEVDAGRR
jgi:hypothetical protein